MRLIFTLLAIVLVGNHSFAQTARDQAVELSATVQVSPPRITLRWKPVAFGSPYYVIFRKEKSSTMWPLALATLTSADTTYVDATVVADSAYEYKVVGISGTSVVAAGYIYAGIKAPAIHSRGAIILLVDSTYSDSCAAALKTYMNDLSGDGWQVIRHDMARTRPDTYIRSVIANDNATHPNVKAAMIVGHLAVPYSGNFSASYPNPPDGHVPDHNGAWPADVYYACFTGTWTDATVTNTGATSPVNRNIPGDGKWDQTWLPSTAMIQVSRVDFYNMPAFTASEFQLMRSYLNRDHIYKMDSLVMRHRGLIRDNFGYMSGEAFAANGWRNFAPLVGRDSVAATSALITDLAASSCQWSYGCGPGSYTSASGVGTTADFVSNPFNGIFTMLFGSYFGDWNVQNNFLRAPLCSSTPALTNCWAARPNWFFHHMALGENIGFAALITHNNGSSLYIPEGYGNGMVHVGLMGDLSLRTDYIKPVLNLNVTTPWHAGAVLNWTASPDPGVIGYYVYRADSAYGYFQRLNATMITGTTYNDLLATNGLKYYMVRPVKLQSTPSGGYYNLGVGVTDTGTITFSVLQVAEVKPTVKLSVFPNPAQDYLNVTVNTANAGVATMYVVNALGQRFDMVTKNLNSGDNSYMLNISGKAPGMYSLVVECGNARVVEKWVKL